MEQIFEKSERGEESEQAELIGSCECPINVWSRDGTLYAVYSLISPFSHGQSTSTRNAQATQILKTAKIPFCPHLCSDDWRYVDYFKKRRSGRIGTLLWATRQRMTYCPFCITNVCFFEPYNTQGIRNIYAAFVSRKLSVGGEVVPVTDARWTRQVIKPKRLPVMNEKWERNKGAWPQEATSD